MGGGHHWIVDIFSVLCGACDLLRKIGHKHHHHHHHQSKDGSGVMSSGGGSLGDGLLGGGSMGCVDDGYDLFDYRRQLYDVDERALFRSFLLTLDSYTCQVRTSRLHAS